MSTRTKLEDMLAAPEEVTLPRGKLEVSGIGAEQITTLLVTYKDQFMGFLSQAISLEQLVLSAPELVKDILAAATGRADERDALGRMPLQYQIDAMAAVYRLSVPDEKKFFQSLAQLADKLRSAKGIVALSGNSSPTPSLNTSTLASGSGTDSQT